MRYRLCTLLIAAAGITAFLAIAIVATYADEITAWIKG